MVYPPAKCRVCGAVVKARDFAMTEDAKFTTFSGCSWGPCPHCGGMCDVLDGVYSPAADDAIELLSGPQSTFDILREAAGIARDSQAAGESTEKTFQRVAEVIPALAKTNGRLEKVTKHLIVWALFYLAGKLLDTQLDPLLKKPDFTAAQLSALVAESVDKGIAMREGAAQKAGVAEKAAPAPQAPRQMTPAPQYAPGLQFPKSMEKLQRQMHERYRPKRGKQ